MLQWIIGAIIFILIVIAVVWWRVRRRKHAMRFMMLRNQQLCDQDVARALTQLDRAYPAPLRSPPGAD